MADEKPAAEKQLWLEKFYLKELRLVAPDSPERFQSQVNAESQLNVRSVHKEISDQYVDVALILRIKALVGDNEVFRIEMAQAGVFTLTGFEPDERLYVLGCICPAMLYPYARQTVAQLVRRCGFSDLLLKPLDFDAMYAQNMRERAQATGNA